MINVFVIGSKGIPAKYGGFETFVEKLTLNKKSSEIKYFVSCMSEAKEFEHNNATCFSIKLKKDTAFYRMVNVSNALKWVEKYIESKSCDDTNIVYVLGCRVGLLFKKHSKKLHKLGCIVVVNPDGLEWKRDKWKKWQKKVLLYSEKKLIKNSDYIICDSKGIKDYITNRYPFYDKDKIEFIAYGSDIYESKATFDDAKKWLLKYDTAPFDYYLVVGRFVAENNFELMIDNFMKSKTNKKLLMITNVEKNKYYQYLQNKLNFESDKRIVFAGTLYNEELLKKIRELAFAYLHGHSVGGTNPSLLEALSYTKINILYDVPFNSEVGQEQCLYFDHEAKKLSEIIDALDNENIYKSYLKTFKSVEIIRNNYSWDSIIDKYENFFTKIKNN